jgi:hypothetical protein
VGGALPEAELVNLVTLIGFEQARVTHRFDCVGGTSREQIARWFGVTGMNLHAVKPLGHG